MNSSSKSQCARHGWLDSLAISMSVICAVHCLLTPILIIALPILATTFWVHEDFHLWMLLLVLPTTTLAIFMGCRKHKDKLVFALSFIGLAFLITVSVYESFSHVNQFAHDAARCVQCTAHLNAGHFLRATVLANIVGGLFLASAHVRNYRMCRSLDCTHD